MSPCPSPSFCWAPVKNRAKYLPGGTVVKNLPATAGAVGDEGLIPGLGRSPGEGNGNSLQYSRLGNAMGRGVWWATVHGVTESQTRLSTHLHLTTQWRSPALRLACGSLKTFGSENVQLIHKLGNTHIVSSLSSHHVGDQPVPCTTSHPLPLSPGPPPSSFFLSFLTLSPVLGTWERSNKSLGAFP